MAVGALIYGGEVDSVAEPLQGRVFFEVLDAAATDDDRRKEVVSKV